MNNKKLILFGFLIIFLVQKVISQTVQEQNIIKYWEHRDRLKKYFLKIGPNNGESLPANYRNHYMHNIMRWSDCTSELGFYIMLLSTEYKLLQDEGLNTREVETELYFAINAVKRLDKRGEMNYGAKLLNNNTISENENGWYNRDDIGENFWTNWSITGVSKSFSDYYNTDVPISQNHFATGNEPSIDQTVYLFLGFRFVIEYVDPNLTLDPIGNGGFNLVSECKQITHRMITNFLEFKDNKANSFENKSAFFTKKNFSFGNPITGEECTGGHDDFGVGLAVPLMLLAEEITGNTYQTGYKIRIGNDLSLTLTIPYEQIRKMFYKQGVKNDGQFPCLDLPALISDIGLGSIAFAGNFGVDLSGIAEYVFISASAEAWDISYEEAEQRLQVCWQEMFVYNHLVMNRRLLYSVSCGISPEKFRFNDFGEPNNNNPVNIDMDYIQNRINTNGSRIYSLIIDVLNNQTVSVDNKAYFEDKLFQMPQCDGAYDFTANTETNIPLSGNAGFWRGNNVWLPVDGSERTYSDDSPSDPRGNKTGIDFMLLYNLYRIATSNTISYPSYNSNIYCPCKTNVFPLINNSLNSPNINGYTEIILPEISNNTSTTITNNRTIHPYQFDYESYNISLERYLIGQPNIQGPGTLYLNENVKVCSSGKLSISSAPNQAGGKVMVGDGQANNSTLRFSRGTILEIFNNGILDVSDNSKVIIEEGAILKIYSGAIIQLNGENAVLEIRGKLELMPNAIFQPTGTGHVLFNIQNADPSIAPFNIAGTATSQIIFESTASPKSLKFIVAAGTYIYPQQSLQMFKIDGVKGIIGQNAEIILGSEFQLQNSNIEGYESFGFTFTTLNFTPTIHHNTFVGGRRALTFIGRDNGRDIKIRYNTFQSILNTINMYDHSAHIAGNNFTDNSGGVFAGVTLRNTPPIQGGLYKGRLRMELNRFENSSALEIHGAFYPSAIVGGNVAHYTPTGSNATRTDITVAIENAHATLKCNWFENQGEAVYHGMSGNLNMSTQRQSHYALGSGGAYVTGGNNFFKTNLRSIVVNSQNIQSPFTFATYDINQGQNSFTAIPSNSRTSLIVDRRWNIQSMNYTLNPSGDMEINGNFWSPILSTSNYPAGFPSNVIERNYYISNHFNIYEYQSPNYIVGTNAPVSNTCPVSVWNDAISDPTNFDPLVGVAFGFNYGSTDPVKVYFDRPFGLNGEGFSYPPTTVTSGTYSGQGFGAAFHNALTGMTVQTTDENNNTFYVPNPVGMLNIANLLISTSGHSTTDEVSIYSFAYKSYLQCLSRAAAVDVFEGNTTSQDAQISAALAVLNAIESNNQQFELSMPERYYQTRFAIGIDKLHLYRLFERYTDAQAVLSNLASFAESDEMVTVNYLSCHVENERKLYNNEISWVDYRNNLNNCGMLYGSPTLISNIDSIGWGDSTQSSGSSSSTPSLDYVISPNPATSGTSVIIDMNIDATVTLTVFNKFGQQVVTTQNLGALLTGSQTTATVTLSGLPADTYNMVVYANGIPYVKHFIKLTE